MRVEMTQFYYYFTLEGGKGGLFSLSGEYGVEPATGDSQEDVKGAMRDLVQVHTDMLDGLFDKVLTGSRKPVLVDSPGSISTGYNYDCSLKKRPEMLIRRRLAEQFGADAVDARGGLSFIHRGRARIVCSAQRSARGFERVSIKTEYELGHMLNVCCFHFLKGLEGVALSANARRDLDSLHRVLTAERNTDHYQAMLEGR